MVGMLDEVNVRASLLLRKEQVSSWLSVKKRKVKLAALRRISRRVQQMRTVGDTYLCTLKGYNSRATDASLQVFRNCIAKGCPGDVCPGSLVRVMISGRCYQ